MLSSARLRLALLAAVLPAGVVLARDTGFQTYDTVEIRGARYIPETDIRSTCGELEGVPLDDIDLSAIQTCLMYTGVFESVDVRPQGQTLLIEVSEVPVRPGRVDAGLAWSNDFGLNATLNYEQLNLIPGTWIAIRNTWSEDYKAYQFSLYGQEPVGPGLRLALDLGGTRESYGELDYSARRDQAEAWALWQPSEGFSLEAGLGYRDQRMTEVLPGASPLLRSEAGSVSAPFLRFAVEYEQKSKNATEEAQPPRLTLRAEQFLWNLGTDKRLAELRLSGRFTHQIDSTWQFSAGLQGGLVRGLNGARPTALDRGFAGGETLRGFAPRGVGPIDGTSRLGGERWVTGSLELRRPLPFSFAEGLNGGVFLDVGSAWRLSNTLGGRIDDSAKLRSSFGLSLSFDVAKVPVSLYIASPVSKRPGDRRQVFGLTAAATF